MAFTANLLARGTRHALVANKLLRLAARLTPGRTVVTHVAPAMFHRPLPPQWRGYESAWSIVLAVLRNQSLLNSTGKLSGFEVAIEPWPLLETLLARVLRTAVEQLNDRAATFVSVPKRQYPVLKLKSFAGQSFEEGSDGQDQFLEPDGLITRNDSALATFEAKYTTFDGRPEEHHIYQALTAAAVLSARVSVLVYPGQHPPRWYDVQGFGGRPAKLVALGLDMYSYKRAGGDSSRAEEIKQILSTPHIPAMSRAYSQ